MTRIASSSLHTFSIAGPAARAAALLILRDEEGRRGVGEAAPLPRFTAETLGATMHALDAVCTSIDALDDTLAPLAAVARALAPHTERLSAVPTARFALETALLDLLAQRRGVDVATCLREAPLRAPAEPPSIEASTPAAAAGKAPREAPSIEASALIPSVDGAPALVEAGLAAIARGFRTLKVKLRAADDASLDRESEALIALRGAAPHVTLRLDPNGRWTLADARRRLARLACVAPAFVEQPVPAEDLADLGPCAVPWAADESLGLPSISDRLTPAAGCAAFVLKPAALGIAGALGAARIARARSLDVVVTHFLDGPIGLAAACELALSLDPPPLASGLDPHTGLRAFAPEALPHHRHPARVHSTGRPGLGFTPEALDAILARASAT